VTEKPVKQWKCTVCGHVHEGEAPPAPCPVCGVGAEMFERLAAAVEAKPA
jgi:rubrerythrin